MIKKAYKNHRETIHNFSWRALQIFAKQGITFLIFILSAKILTPYDFGIYNYALAIIFFLIMFGDFGISTATSKYVAEYNSTNKEKLKSVLFNPGIVILILSILITILTLSFGYGYFGEKYIYILYLLPLVFLAPMTSLYDGIYRGLKKFKSLAIISWIIGVISVFFVFYFIKSYGLLGALISQNLFYLFLLIGLAGGYREFNFKLNKVVMKEIGNYSFIYGLALLGNYLFIRFGILILGHYNYIEEIATYQLISQIFFILLLPFTLLGQVIAPNFAIMAVKKEHKKIFLKAKKYTIQFAFAGISLGVLFYFILPIFFRLFFNNYYSKDYFGLTFLLCLIIYSANVFAATFDAGILIPTGHASIMAKFYIFLGIFGVLLSLLFVHLMGFIGVVLSFTISSLLMVIGLRVFYFYKTHKFH